MLPELLGGRHADDSTATANIPAADLARARTFYADKLGLTPSGENPGGLVHTTSGGTRYDGDVATLDGMGHAAWFTDSEGNTMCIDDAVTA